MPNSRLPRGAFARLGFLAAIGAASIAPHLARADEVAACRLTYASAVQISEAVKANEPEIAFHDYGGADAVALVREFNAVPPVSERQADHVLVIERDDDVRVALAASGCVFIAFRLPQSAWAEARRKALGEGA